ncbi:hypothetical protein MMC31_005848, partial [Peltigera leucophlebia]|nr:hypothetical protein [Peltigera leucophlebia]
LPLLHPSVLLLTKIKRWTGINRSTFLPDPQRAPNDPPVIEFLAKLLDNNGSQISFQLYHAQYPEILDQTIKDAVTYLQSERLLAQPLEFSKSSCLSIWWGELLQGHAAGTNFDLSTAFGKMQMKFGLSTGQLSEESRMELVLEGAKLVV